MSLDDRNAELDKALEENPIDEQIAALARSDRSRHRQIRWLAFSLALDVLLTIGFGYTTLRANDAASKAETTQVAILRNCETANESRKNNAVLWDFVLAQPPREPLDAKQQKIRDDFVELKNKTFAQRDCQAELKTIK